MFKLVQYATIIFFLFVAYKQFIPQVEESSEFQSIKETVTAPPVPEEVSKQPINPDLAKLVGKETLQKIDDSQERMGYMERKLLGMVNNWSKTPEGKVLLDRVIKSLPAQDPAKVEADYGDVLLDILDIRSGSGPACQCGQTVVGQLVDSNQKFSGQLGSAPSEKFPLAMQFGMIGMQPGAERKIVSMDGKIYHVRLLDYDPKDLPETMYFDKELNLRIANRCGSRVRVALKIHDSTTGNLLYFHRPGESMIVNLNGKQVPYGILAAMVGMSQGGTRNVLLTPRSQLDIEGKPIRDFFPRHWVINSNKTYIVEIKQLLSSTDRAIQQ